MTPEELAQEQAKEAVSGPMRTADGYDPGQRTDMAPDSDEVAAAQEIIDRLNREAAEDEARKQQEIEQARLAAQANFNESTGSYSGSYGAGGADGVHKAQIDAILAEKDDALRDLIEHTGEK